MGCYDSVCPGLAQAAWSKHHDAQGICWPLAIAPFELDCCDRNAQGRACSLALAEQLYAALAVRGWIEVACLMPLPSGPG